VVAEDAQLIILWREHVVIVKTALSHCHALFVPQNLASKTSLEQMCVI
jgi:hypothetical protein